MTDLPADVLAAARRIRDDLHRQEAEVLDSFGTRLGPPTPRPSRDDLEERSA